MHGQQNIKLSQYVSEISSAFYFVLLEDHLGPVAAINMEVKMSIYTDNYKWQSHTSLKHSEIVEE